MWWVELMLCIWRHERKDLSHWARDLLWTLSTSLTFLGFSVLVHTVGFFWFSSLQSDIIPFKSLSTYIRTVPDVQWFILFHFYTGTEWCVFSRNCTLDLNSWLVTFGMLLPPWSVMLVMGHSSQAAPQNYDIKNISATELQHSEVSSRKCTEVT